MQRLRRISRIAGWQPALALQSCLGLLWLGGWIAGGMLMPFLASGQTPLEFTPPALVDNMDGQSPILRPLLAGSGFTIGQRGIDRTHFQQGNGAERIQLRGPAGRTAQVAYSLPPAPVIREFRVRASLLSNRTGIQLAVRVVLPRSVDRSTGRPYELLVRGATFGRGGHWEQITLSDLPRQLASQARVARVQYQTTLDERGAYVSQIVFLVPGGSGHSELVVDQIQVFGVLDNQRQPIAATAIRHATSQQSQTQQSPTFSAPRKPGPISASIDRLSRIPRIVQWQGESFETLQQLGFNTLGMSRLPDAEQLQQASQLGLTLVCPPPSPEQLGEEGIPEEFESVLAWDLGKLVSVEDLASLEQWEQLVARNDPIVDRPTFLAPKLHTLEASRISDIVLTGRPVLGSQLTLREHAAWLAQRRRLMRPGTPLWTLVETQLTPSQQLQHAALSSQGSGIQGTTYAQLTALTSASMGVKTQGFYFQSQSSLAAKDPATQRRALALELTNLRLQLIEPWLNSGKELSAARASQPELSALVMQAERSHLLVPVWWSSRLQSPTSTQLDGPVSFVVPGVAESSEAFLISLTGLQRVPHQRVTGGIHVALEELPFDSLIMLSDDPRAISQVTRYLRRIAPRAAKIRRQLAELRLQEAIRLQARTQPVPPTNDQAQTTLQRAKNELAACDRFLAVANFELAYQRATAVQQTLDPRESEVREQLGAGPHRVPPHHGPLPLPDKLKLQKTIARTPLTANLLAGGGFESLASLLETGWRHQQLPLEDITTDVRLSPEAPHSGSYCLELEARSLGEAAPVTVVPTAPVWISSAPIQVRAGDLIEITGVARLPKPLLGSVDDLQIIDSLGGPDMALRIHHAPSWQPFRVIRAATSDAQLTVTIALFGLGKAQIDDLAIRIVKKQ